MTLSIRHGILVAIACAIGCGGSAQIGRDEFASLPRAYRQEVFDAQNAVTIAQNRQDEAKEAEDAQEQAKRDSAQVWRRTEKRLSESGQGDKVARARKIYDANRAYIDAQVDLAEARIRRAEVETELTRAQLKLVVQRQLARLGRAAVSSIKPQEETIADDEARLKRAATEEGELRTKVERQLTMRKTAEDEYISATSDYNTGIWGN